MSVHVERRAAFKQNRKLRMKEIFAEGNVANHDALRVFNAINKLRTNTKTGLEGFRKLD